MPFESEKQRRYMWANHPEIARRWEHEMGHYSRGHNNDEADFAVPSNGAHPNMNDDVVDPRGSLSGPNDFTMTTFIDNGANYDVGTGNLGYRVTKGGVDRTP